MDWTPAQLPSGRHGLSREYVVNSQRSRLLGAAVLIAGAEGYAGMTVSAVIARAGVSRKTFYEFFQDREDIFLATFDQLLDSALDGARDAYENGGESWPERLRALLQAGLTGARRAPARGETRLRRGARRRAARAAAPRRRAARVHAVPRARLRGRRRRRARADAGGDRRRRLRGHLRACPAGAHGRPAGAAAAADVRRAGAVPGPRRRRPTAWLPEPAAAARLAPGAAGAPEAAASRSTALDIRRVAGQDAQTGQHRGAKDKGEVLMPTAQVTVEEVSGRSVAAVAFSRALRDRAQGRAVDACASWARLEQEARDAGSLHLAVQAGAERSLTLTWMGALSVAGVLCEQLLEELGELEREPERLVPPPLSPAVINGWAGAWFSVSGLHRLRAEQLRRAGDYAGALEELEEANRSADQRPDAALPLWGRVILSESLRLAGDVDGAYEVAAAAAAAAASRRRSPVGLRHRRPRRRPRPAGARRRRAVARALPRDGAPPGPPQRRRGGRLQPRYRRVAAATRPPRRGARAARRRRRRGAAPRQRRRLDPRPALPRRAGARARRRRRRGRRPDRRRAPPARACRASLAAAAGLPAGRAQQRRTCAPSSCSTAPRRSCRASTGAAATSSWSATSSRTAGWRSRAARRCLRSRSTSSDLNGHEPV